MPVVVQPARQININVIKLSATAITVKPVARVAVKVLPQVSKQIVVQPRAAVSVVVSGVRGPAGPPGPPGASGSNWGYIKYTAESVTLTNQNYVDLDCTNNDIVVTLASATALAGGTVILYRTVGGDNIITVQDEFRNVIYYMLDIGESLELIANNGTWRIS
jgi:hypothetical protein